MAPVRRRRETSQGGVGDAARSRTGSTVLHYPTHGHLTPPQTAKAWAESLGRGGPGGAIGPTLGRERDGAAARPRRASFQAGIRVPGRLGVADSAAGGQGLSGPWWPPAAISSLPPPAATSSLRRSLPADTGSLPLHDRRCGSRSRAALQGRPPARGPPPARRIASTGPSSVLSTTVHAAVERQLESCTRVRAGPTRRTDSED